MMSDEAPFDVASMTAETLRTRVWLSRVIVWGLVALVAWIAADLYLPARTNLRVFDGAAVGRMEADMWRSYYERRPVRLFWQLAGSLRTQYHSSFRRSFSLAYRAARAAFVFKDGRNRDDYAKALPDLTRYFAELSALSRTPFDVAAAAHDELEWWIIRREPDRFTTADWEHYVAAVASQVYQLPVERTATFAKVRVEAMVLRDRRGAGITESDWAEIRALLERAWGALAEQVSGQRLSLSRASWPTVR